MTRFDDFRALHHADRPLLLPNAWDHASAALLAAEGFPAVGTTSLGVAAAAGLPDAGGVAREATLALALRLARLPVPITVDIENGFADDPGQVAALARELAAAGIAGVNIEDGRPGGEGLTDPAVHAEKITAIKDAAPELFVNARTDTYWLGRDQETTLARAETYRRAGADGVFVPGLRDEQTVADLVRALDPLPLNLLLAPAGPTYSDAARLGVRRVSTGSLLYRAALRAAVGVAVEAAGGQGPDLPSYDDIQGLSLQ